VIAYLKSHVKPLGLAIAAIYTALRPWLIDGQSWTVTNWLAFAVFLGGAVATYLQRNSTTGIAYWAKTIWAALAAGLGALLAVVADGVSRADVGTIIAAVAAVVFSLVQGDTPVHPKPGQPGNDGEDIGDNELQSIFFALGALAFLVFIANVAYIRFSG
jgi:hypothetical protein